MANTLPSADPRLGCRLLVLCIATPVAAALTATATAWSVAAQRGSDADPRDPARQGRGGADPRTGLTDADPRDSADKGRGGTRFRSSVSDADPQDPPRHDRGR